MTMPVNAAAAVAVAVAVAARAVGGGGGGVIGGVIGGGAAETEAPVARVPVRARAPVPVRATTISRSPASRSGMMMQQASLAPGGGADHASARSAGWVSPRLGAASWHGISR